MMGCGAALRKKLKLNNATIDFQAIYGIGYKLVTANEQ